MFELSPIAEKGETISRTKQATCSGRHNEGPSQEEMGRNAEAGRSQFHRDDRDKQHHDAVVMKGRQGRREDKSSEHCSDHDRWDLSIAVANPGVQAVLVAKSHRLFPTCTD